MKGIPTSYSGIMFRSILEAKWAMFFDRIDWRWSYEPIELSGYIPDFIITSFKEKMLVEVKPILPPYKPDSFAEAMAKAVTSGWNGPIMVVGQSDHDGGYLKPDDALYIAACDPTTIIALCDEVARLRKQETRLRIGEECHVARPGEGTYECDAQKPCPACRLRSAEAEVERLRAELAAAEARITELRDRLADADGDTAANAAAAVPMPTTREAYVGLEKRIKKLEERADCASNYLLAIEKSGYRRRLDELEQRVAALEARVL